MSQYNFLFLCSDQHSPHVLGAHGNRIWDNAVAYNGRTTDSWGHRLTEQGRTAITFGKLHYEADSPTGFDERNPMYKVPGSTMAEAYSLYRETYPDFPKFRQNVLDAGPGEFSYTPFDRKTTELTVDWLKNDSTKLDKPWAAFVSWAYPHYPFIAPQEFVDLYPLDKAPLPSTNAPAQWSQHPRLANADNDTSRLAFSEYHAIYSTAVVFMLRSGPWKYCPPTSLHNFSTLTMIQMKSAIWQMIQSMPMYCKNVRPSLKRFVIPPQLKPKPKPIKPLSLNPVVVLSKFWPRRGLVSSLRHREHK